MRPKEAPKVTGGRATRHPPRGRRGDAISRRRGRRGDAISRRRGSLVESNQSYSQIQRNEETRYEYLKDIGQDLARHWPKGLANLGKQRSLRAKIVARQIPPQRICYLALKNIVTAGPLGTKSH